MHLKEKPSSVDAAFTPLHLFKNGKTQKLYFLLFASTLSFGVLH